MRTSPAWKVVEQAFPGAPIVMPEGPAGLAEALALGAGAGVFTVPDDITSAELDSALQFCSTLGTALAAIPAEVRHGLGGDGPVGFWQPEDSSKVAQLLTYYVNVSRIVPLDPTPMVTAVQGV